MSYSIVKLAKILEYDFYIIKKDRRCLKSGRSLTGNGVGELRIGRAIDEVRSRCRITHDAIELDEEAQPQRTMTVVTAYGDLLVAVDSGRIWRITPTASTIRTADSLGVGSNITDLLNSSSGKGFEGEGALYVVLKKQCGLSFRLAYDIPYADHREKWRLTDLQRIPKSVKVDQVFAVGCDKSANSE